MRSLDTIQRGLAALIGLAVAAQFFLAGAGAFGAITFKPHQGVGWATGALGVLALALALISRRWVRVAVALFATIALQVVLGVIGANSSAWIGALHGLNALLVAGASAAFIWVTWFGAPGRTQAQAVPSQ